MYRFKPEDIMPFGVNKGHSLSQIYKYAPEYIEWLILETDFKIEMDEFEKLPISTPFDFKYYKIDFRFEERRQIRLKEEIRRKIDRVSLTGLSEFVESTFWKQFNVDHSNFYNSIDVVQRISKSLKVVPEPIAFRFNEKAIEQNLMSSPVGIYEPNDDSNDSFPKEEYIKYNGYNGYCDDAIDIAFEGDPLATWNVD